MARSQKLPRPGSGGGSVDWLRRMSGCGSTRLRRSAGVGAPVPVVVAGHESPASSSAIATAVAPAAGAARCRRAAISAVMPASVAAALTALAVSRGRSVIHSSSPSTARVDQACSFAGLGKITGLAAIQHQ
jgi:hypothetical protein